MARTAEISKGTYLPGAVETGVTAGMVQNIGPGVLFVVIASSEPDANVTAVGTVGFEVQPGFILPISGLGGTDNVYLGAVADACTAETVFA